MSWTEASGNVSSWKTGYAYDPKFPTFYQDPETPDRVKWINDRISHASYYVKLNPVNAISDPMTWISKVHTPEHIQSIKDLTAYSGYVPVSQIAELAVGYALGAIGDVCEGRLRNAFCCIRPPGHHVINNGYSGYCYYANAAIAVRYAQEAHSIKRVLLVDWDLHHGNGTQNLICGNTGVLFFDTFQYVCCGPETACSDFVMEAPDTPGSDADGVSKLRINIQMPSGSGNRVFQTLFDTRLRAAAQAFKPQLVLVSCGFDLKQNDTHGTLRVTAAGISGLTKTLMEIADTYAEGKLVALLEGGYADTDGNNTYNGLAECVDSLVATLVSGEIQNESPYFASQAVKRSGGCQHTPLIIGDFLTVPVNAHSILVYNGLGRTVRNIGVQTSDGCSFDMRKTQLGPGFYIFRILDATGNTLCLWSYMQQR
jgi:acetoin utilization deacetylase AcuC-like enzyme